MNKEHVNTSPPQTTARQRAKIFGAMYLSLSENFALVTCGAEGGGLSYSYILTENNF